MNTFVQTCAVPSTGRLILTFEGKQQYASRDHRDPGPFTRRRAFTEKRKSEDGHQYTGTVQTGAGVLAGFVIGMVASIMGVAGGELLIPTLVNLMSAARKRDH
ncbi:MAG: hypothetical protein ACXW20_19735 [Burkholderiales bacterium]